MTLLTNIAPIALGFIGKLFALKSQAAQENQKLMMQQFAVRDKSIMMQEIEQTKKALWLHSTDE